jgi:hypothetical protein
MGKKRKELVELENALDDFKWNHEADNTIDATGVTQEACEGIMNLVHDGIESVSNSKVAESIINNYTKREAVVVLAHATSTLMHKLAMIEVIKNMASKMNKGI